MSTLTLRALKKGLQKVADADRIIKLEAKDFMRLKPIAPGELILATAGHAGTGKSFMAQQLAMQALNGGTSSAVFQTDPRISAISRDGNKIEINYDNFEKDKIPGLIDWMTANGIGHYSLESRYLTFANDVDADLFWLTFVNINLSRFSLSKGNLDELQAAAKEARQHAMKNDVAVIFDYEGKTGVLSTNAYRGTK